MDWLRVLVPIACAAGCRQIFGIEPVAGDGGDGGGNPDGRGDGARRDAPGDGVDGSGSGVGPGVCVAAGKTYTCGARDAYVSAGASSTNFGSDPTLALSTTSAGDFPMLFFDLSSIPTTATVATAQLSLVGTTMPLTTNAELYAVTGQWIEDEVTWIQASTGLAWVGGMGPTYSSPSFATFTPAQGASSISIASQVQTWVTNPAGNHGMIMNTHDSGGMATFASNDATSAASWPQLVVTIQ